MQTSQTGQTKPIAPNISQTSGSQPGASPGHVGQSQMDIGGKIKGDDNIGHGAESTDK
jgi:hypothetical protein